MTKKLLIIIGVVIVFLLFVVVFLLPSKNKDEKTSVQTQPTTSQAVPNKYYWTQKNREASKKSSAVGDLIDKLPYKGEDFSMSYDINEDIFTVLLNSGNIASANKEFDLFLSGNNIGDRGWISNLVIKKEALRP